MSHAQPLKAVCRILIALPLAGVVACTEDVPSGPACHLLEEVEHLTVGAAADPETFCLPHALETDDTGLVRCYVVEVIPDGVFCDQLFGRHLIRMSDPAFGEPPGREACLVDQSPAGADGWYYDEAPSARCPLTRQHILVTPTAPARTEVRLECQTATCASP